MGWTMTFARNVGAGIAFLNKNGPKGWKRVVSRAIKEGVFDINSSAHCVLGEVYGDYWEAKDKLQLFGDREWLLGFRAYSADVETLEAAWIAAYKKGLLRNR